MSNVASCVEIPRMRYSAKPGNPSKSSIRQIKLYSVAVKTAVSVEQLEALGEALLDFGQLADLVAWLATV